MKEPELSDLELDQLSSEVRDAIEKKDNFRLSRYFEKELDEIHTPKGSSYWSAPSETTSEAEQRERDDHELRAALARKADEILKGDGIHVAKVTISGERDAYIFFARDRQGRTYEAKLPFEDAILANQGDPVGMVTRLAGWVVEGIRSERDRWFRRMTS